MSLHLARADRIHFEISPIVELAQAEMCTGFYLYQLMMYQVWIWYTYLLVGCVMSLVVVLSAGINIWLAFRHQRQIGSLCKVKQKVSVRRSGDWEKIDSADLVVGDIIRVEANWIPPADLAILSGSAVCDEAGLTGESMPVGKTALPVTAELFDIEKHKSSVLYSGTKVLQAGASRPDPSDKDNECNPRSDDSTPIEDASEDDTGWVEQLEKECSTDGTAEDSGGDTVAVVVATGIHTNKGQLISEILYPIPMMFKYDEEFPLYFFVLFCYAMLCFWLSVYFVDANGSYSFWVAKWTYGIFTCSQVLSPMLPIALVVGENMAAKRLKAHGIFCMNAKRIAIAGKIRVFCFDKTGTLTRAGLDFLGVQEITRGEAGAVVAPVKNHAEVVKEGEQPAMDGCQEHMRILLATCHNLKQFGDRMVGNQVEVNMFASCGAQLKEENGVRIIENWQQTGDTTTTTKLRIVKTFEFDHARMTMSVVVRTDDGNCVVYCKGAPERVTELCAEASCPADFTEVHRGHSLQGCYVLGAAMKDLGKLSDQQLLGLTRNDVETEGLQLLGLLRFRNEIKIDTAEAIKELQEGDVRCIMLTGDNAQCGAHIAVESGMIDADQTIIFGDAIMTKDAEEAIATLDREIKAFESTGAAPREGFTVQAATASKLKLEEIVKQATLNGSIGLVQWSSPSDEDVTADIQMIEAISKEPTIDPGDLFQRVELAVTQKVLDVMSCNNEQAGDIDNLLLHIRIFSRLRPDGKVIVIEKLWNKQLVVGMCGDGGNDCGALRVAHAGTRYHAMSYIWQ